MNQESKLYQLIIGRLDGGRICDHAYQEGILTLARKGIGGFIIFGGTREYLRPFIDRLQSIAEIPLFIASDIERGVGQQIDGYTNFPCQMAVRAAVNRDVPDDMAILRDVVKAVALEAIDAGINMPLIPVLDVNSNPDNPIICTRAFSDNPEDVSFFGSEYIRVLEGMELISCAKHFPGHGDTSTDSHISLPLIRKSYDDLVNFDVRPFAHAIKTGVSSIMIGHLMIPSMDDSVPSSLSKKVITDLLRKELGFNGLIMTDAVSTGLISEETIDTAIDRILKAKSRFAQITGVEIDFHSNSLISKRMTEMSITVVNKKEGVLPVADDGKIQVFIAGEERLCEKSLWVEKFPPLEKGGEGGFESGYSDEAVIIAIFSEVAAWRGSAGIDDKAMEQVKELIMKARTSIVISFGSPYILRHFSDADVLIAAYEANGLAQKAVIKCLKEEACIGGKLPVRL